MGEVELQAGWEEHATSGVAVWAVGAAVIAMEPVKVMGEVEIDSSLRGRRLSDSDLELLSPVLCLEVT